MKTFHEKSNIDGVVGIAAERAYDVTRDKFLKSYNIHPAKVVTLKDPFRSGNIGVKITGVHEEDAVNRPQDVLYAPMLMPFGGGDNYGFFAMPPIGSDVMVTFIDGDLKNPIILGSWQSRKMVRKVMTSQNEVGSMTNSSKSRAMTSVYNPNTFGSNPSNVNPVQDLAENVKSYSSKLQTLSLSSLTSNAKSMIGNFVKGGELSSQIQTLTGGIGVPAGIQTAFGDMISGKIGQIPGLSDAPQAFTMGLDTKFGDFLTQMTNDMGAIAQQTANHITEKLTALAPQATTLLSTLSDQKTLANVLKTNVMENLNGGPGFLAKGLASLKSNLLSGAISPAIASTLANAPVQLQQVVNSSIDNAISSTAKSVTSLTSLNNTFDNVLKNTKIINEVGSGNISLDSAVKGVSNGSTDYLLAKDSEQDKGYAFGPQCPLPYRNQIPARTLEELGENFTDETGEQEQIDSCYLSTDKKDEKNGQYITPEPVVYMWKSPQGSSIEIDDTGYANEDNTTAKGIDNRGIRLTTKKGALIHLVDEKNYEGVLFRDKNNNYIWIDSTTNTIHLYAQNGIIEDIVADRTTNCANKREVVTGDNVKYIEKDKKEVVAGSTNHNCNKDLIENVGGAWSITVHGNVNIWSAQDVNIVAANKCIMGGKIHTIIEGNRIDLNSGV